MSTIVNMPAQITAAWILWLMTGTGFANTNVLESFDLREGLRLFGERNYAGALPLLERASKDGRVLPDVLNYYLGACHFGTQAVVQAKDYFGKGAQSSFNQEEATWGLYLVASSQGDVKQTSDSETTIARLAREREQRRWTVKCPDPPSGRTGWSSHPGVLTFARLYFDQGCYEKAIAYCEWGLGKIGMMDRCIPPILDNVPKYPDYELKLYRKLVEAYSLWSQQLGKQEDKAEQAVLAKNQATNYALRAYIVESWIAFQKRKNEAALPPK